MMDEIVAGLKSETGRDLNSWVAVLRKMGLPSRKEQVAWLIAEHKLGRTVSNRIAAVAAGAATDYHDQEGLLEAMYAGPKAALKSIYEKLVAIGRGFGPEFSLYQCAGQTTFKRNRQFAWIKPATRTRVDLGLALPGIEPQGRLLPVKGSNDKDRVRLRIELTDVEAVDGEVEQWLYRAWLADASR